MIAPREPQNGAGPPASAELIARARLAACIHCGLCDAACPALSHQPDFVGPAALALAWRVGRDPLDRGDAQRQPVLAGARGVWNCTQSQTCSRVCPRGVDPAQAVQRSQLETALRAVGLRATRTLPPRSSDGWPLGPPYLRAFLLSLAGVALSAVNVVLLRAAWALGGGASAWEAHLVELRSVPALALHTLLCGIACGFALGFLGVAARVAGQRRRAVLAGGLLALAGAAALGLALYAGRLG
jgi:ferredoxin